jgi:hypothetical protein
MYAHITVQWYVSLIPRSDPAMGELRTCIVAHVRHTCAAQSCPPLLNLYAAYTYMYTVTVHN